MKYVIFLVFCGTLALEADGMRVRVLLQESENESFGEDTGTSARRLVRVKKRFEKQYPTKDTVGDRWKAPKMDKKYEYEKSVDKILNAVKKIVTKGEPLLYPKSVACGRGVAVKCQYTPNKTEDEWFFGYQGKPRKIIMRAMDAVDKLVSHPILRAYVEMLDYSVQDSAVEIDKTGTHAAEDPVEGFKMGKLLMIVKRVVHRDPEVVQQRFVCGIQMDKESANCRYYDEEKPIIGFKFDAADVNDAVRNIFTSREVMKGFVKFAKDEAGIFPALKPRRQKPGSDDARSTNNVGLPAAQIRFRT